MSTSLYLASDWKTEMLFLGPEHFGMEFYDLADVRAEIGCAVVAGVEMEFVFDVLFLKLLIERCRAYLEVIFVVAPAIEINGERADGSLVFLSQDKRIVLIPMSDVDRIPEYGTHQFAKAAAGAHRGVKFLRRLGHEGCALRADG